MKSLQKNAASVWLYARLMRFGAWLQEIPNKITPPAFRLLQIGSAFWQSRALYVAARLDVATVLGDATLSADEIAARVSAQPDAVFRLLRMLAAMGIFEEASPRTFRNNRVSGHLREDRSPNVRAMILMHNSEEMSRPWYEQLEPAVRTGEIPFRLQYGNELFAYMDDHPDLDRLFSEAMDSVEALAGDGFATDFDWGRFDRIIDVGGSRGRKSLSILKRHPRPTALVVDRAQVIREAETYWEGREDPALLARMRFEAGDMFESVPAAEGDGDIYLLSAVLHGVEDDGCVKVLRNVADACSGTGARVAVMEMVLADVHADFVGSSFDMQMFMGTRGRERTLGAWRQLFARSGLLLEQVVDLRSVGKILVLRPTS